MHYHIFPTIFFLVSYYVFNSLIYIKFCHCIPSDMLIQNAVLCTSHTIDSDFFVIKKKSAMPFTDKYETHTIK